MTFSLIAVGLAGRSALDKLLTLRGGAELVALWAQLAAVIEMVAGVVMSGVGTGLVVYIARAKQPERQRGLLNEALKIGLLVALPVAAAIGVAGYAFSDPLTGGKVAPALFALSATAGWIVVIPALINNYWMGRQDYGLMLAFGLASTALVLLAVLWAPQRYTLEFLLVSQALPAGVLQALLRVMDWVCAPAAGFLSLIYLPRLAAARSGPGLDAQIHDAARALLLPAAIALAALGFAHRALLEWLYAPGVHASDTATAPFFAGSLVRIAAWIPLGALYAMRRTREITIGELLSLPLFALLTLAAGKQLTLELAGAFWLLSYCAYGLYNFRAMRRRQQRESV